MVREETPFRHRSNDTLTTHERRRVGASVVLTELCHQASALAVTAVIVLIVLPYILAVASVLPAGPAEWLLRVTPAAAFAVQQTLVRYPQVTAAYTPTDGYFPLAPWAGLAVLCAYTLCALGLATYLLRRRDV